MLKCGFTWLNGMNIVCHCKHGQYAHPFDRHEAEEDDRSWVKLGHEDSVRGGWSNGR